VTRLRLRRIFWIGAATILVVAALIALVALVSGSFSETDGKILWTLGALFFTGSAAIAGVALLDRATHVWLGWAIIATAPIAFVLLAVLGWSGWDVSDTVGRFIGTSVLVVAAELVVATNRLLLRNVRLAPVALITEVLVWLATGITLVFIWLQRDPGSTGAKFLAACWILAGLGWFLVPVLQRYAAVQAPVEPSAERVLAALGDVELVATRAVGEGVVVVEEPRLLPGERLALRRRSS
jgi:hypothetical protein